MKNQISVLDFEGVPAIERPFFLTKSGGEKASPFTKFSVYYHLFWREAETHERPSHRFGQSESRCGKTTSCVNLGVGLAQAGKKVLLIDCDPQASLSISLGHSKPDTLPVTLSEIMGKVLNDQPIALGEGILYHAEGVDLMPLAYSYPA